MYKKVQTRYRNNGAKVECQNCSKEIRVGDEYVSRFRRPSKSTPALYCVPCAKELYVI